MKWLKGFRMKIREQVLGLALLGWMVACGGGGSSNSGGTVTPTLAPTPTLVPTPIPTAAPGAVPKVFWVSQPVSPDETMLITGGNLDVQTQVEAAELPDGDPGSPAVVAPTLTAWTMLPPLTLTSRSLTATVPKAWSKGIYALRLKNDSTPGPVRLINAPDPWFVQGDQGETTAPGGTLYVAGACLERAGGVDPQAALVQKGTGTVVAKLSLKERITTSVGYGLRFSVPANTPEGDYEFWIHNGRGGAAAWVKFSTFITAPVDTVTIKKVVAWPATVFDVSQQSGANDDERFAKAIAAADANGGGRIYVPAGNYTLTTRLVLPHRTVLAGAGKTQTLIHWSAAPTGDNFYYASLADALVAGKKRGVDYIMGVPDAASFALEDLSLESNSAFLGPVVARIFNVDRGWFKNVNIRSLAGANSGSMALFLRQTKNTLLENCTLEADNGCLRARNDVSHVRMTGCILNWRGTNIGFDSGSFNLIFVGNTLNQQGDSVSNGWSTMPNPNPGLWFTGFHGSPYTRDILWTGNTSTREEQEVPPGYVGFTSDGSDGIYLGKVAGVNGVKLTLAQAVRTFTIPQRTPNWVGAIAQILDGRGAGQWRFLVDAASSASTIEVDRPWDIEPDASSTITLVNLLGRMLMIDNDFAQVPLNQDYFMSLDSIKAGNRFGVSGGQSAVIGRGGQHYNGTIPSWHFQVLNNRVERGASTNFMSLVADATPNYSGVVASAHVYRNNTNTSGGTADLWIRSMAGAISDVLAEHNQINTIKFRNNVDPISLSGVLLRGNALPSGGATPLQLPTVPGVTVAP
jgi:Pectate lyase superfamily protein